MSVLSYGSPIESLAPARWFLRYRRRGESRKTVGPFGSKHEAQAAADTTREWLGESLADCSIFATRKQAACHVRARR